MIQHGNVNTLADHASRAGVCPLALLWQAFSNIGWRLDLLSSDAVVWTPEPWEDLRSVLFLAALHLVQAALLGFRPQVSAILTVVRCCLVSWLLQQQRRREQYDAHEGPGSALGAGACRKQRAHFSLCGRFAGRVAGRFAPARAANEAREPRSKKKALPALAATNSGHALIASFTGVRPRQ
eukprot:COSAG02_NODE_7285_length_3084_cov_21.424121_4_plen_181_part_00